MRASLRDMEMTLVISVGAGDPGGVRFSAKVRATLIPGIAVPLSLIGTFGVMYLLRLQPRTICR